MLGRHSTQLKAKAKLVASLGIFLFFIKKKQSFYFKGVFQTFIKNSLIQNKTRTIETFQKIKIVLDPQFQQSALSIVLFFFGVEEGFFFFFYFFLFLFWMFLIHLCNPSSIYYIALTRSFEVSNFFPVIPYWIFFYIIPLYFNSLFGSDL